MRIQNSLKNIYTGVFGQFLTLLITFFTRTIFISTLGKTYLGVSGLFGNILGLFSLAELGVGQAITFSLYKAIAKNEQERICGLMNLYKRVYTYIGIFIFIMGISLTPYIHFVIKDINGIPSINIIYVLFVINSSSSYFYMYRSTFIIANQKNYIITRINYIFLVFTNLIQVVMLLFTKNYILYLVAQIILNIIQNIYIARKCLKLYPFLKESHIYELNIEEKKSIFKNIKALMIYKVGTLSLNSTDNIIISSFISVTYVGLYSNYNLIVVSISGFLSSIFNALTASIGNLVSKEDVKKQMFIFDVVYFATSWIYGICSICLFILMSPFIELWIGKEYILDIDVIFITVFNFYLGGLLFAPYIFRQTMGLFRYGKWRPIVSAILNLLISIILVQYIGLSGVLWGTALTRLATNIWYDPYTVYKRGFEKTSYEYFIKYVQYMCVTLLAGVISHMISSYITVNSIYALIIRGMICIIISNIIFFIFYFKKEEFHYLFNIVKKYLYKLKRRGAVRYEK